MFDAGAIMAHLDVDTKLGDDKIRRLEDRLKRLEREPHHINVDARFQDGSTARARKMFADLDNQLSRDAANRLRTSPQGSVLGALNALFSPHPVSGSPTPQQASSQGLLGKVLSSAGTGGGATGPARAVPPASTAPGAPQEQAKQAAQQQQNNRGFWEGVLAGRRGGFPRLPSFGGGGGGGGGGGAGGGGFLSGLFGGIGPGILGLGARNLTLAGLAGPALGALPALVGPLAGLGVAGAGLGAARLLLKGASQQVSPLLQLQNQIQQAQLTAATPQQKQALAAQQASLNQAVSQLPVAQRQMYNAMSAISNGWQNFSQSFAPVLAKGLGMAARLFSSLLPTMKTFFSSSLALIRPFIQGIGDIAKMVLPGLGQAFRAVAPLVRPLLDGLGGLVKGLLPGLVAMLKASRPAVTAFGQILSMIGRDLGSLFKNFAPVMAASSVILKALFGIIGGLLPIIGKLAAYFAKLLAPVFLQFAAAIRALMPFLLTVGKVLAALASAVLKDLAGALVAVANLLTGIAPSLNIVAKAFSQMFSILENTGVFASLGTALEKITPSLATLVNTLVRQLAPELPVIITLVSQFSTILIDLLAAGLTTVLKGITFLLQKMPFLVPVIGAVAAAWLAWNLIVSANPLGLIILAITAVVGAITLLATHWHQVWSDIKNWAMDAWNFLTHGWGQFLVPGLTIVRLAVDYFSKHWKGAWNDIKSVALGAWGWLQNNIWHPFDNLLTKTLPGWWNTAVSAIGTAWNAVKNAVETPVKWVVDNVLNGLINVFDWISGKVGGPHITNVHPFGLAEGGKIEAGTGPTADDVLVRVSRGETVVSAAHSGILAPFFAALGIHGYARGGVPHPGSVSAHVGQNAPGGGGLLDNLFGGAVTLGKILAAISTGNEPALANAITGLLPSGVGGAVADLAQLLLDIPRNLVIEAAKDLIGIGSAGVSSNAIVGYAMSWLGKIPYVWGGTAVPGGADCSGFTQAIYRHFGITAPRTSEEQGAWVKRGPPTPGGLAFYNSPAGGPPPGHVAIVGANGKVISQGGGLGPQLVPLHAFPLMWTGIPPGGFGRAGTRGAGGPGTPIGVLQNWARSQVISMWPQPGEWTAFDNVVNRESGWQWNAQNPSGAYGIPQALPGNKMASAGSDWRTDPYTQLRWMFGYIRSVYHDPIGAWNSELTRGWYDTGGWLMPGGLNGTGRPEAVLTNTQSDAFIAMAHALAGQGQTASMPTADQMERLITAVNKAAGQTGAVIGSVLNGTARNARQRAGTY